MKNTNWRLHGLAAFIAGMFLFTINLSAQNNNAKMEDVATQDAIIASLYDVISGPAGEKRDWNRMRSLFTSTATLNAMRKDKDGNIRMVAMTLDNYIERAGSSLEKNGFFEDEIGRKTESFGQVTHIFSTYQSKRTADGEVFARGINSIQLMNDGKRYWIVNILWDSEREGNTIPKKYLKKK